MSPINPYLNYRVTPTSCPNWSSENGCQCVAPEHVEPEEEES
jgi:hypothetical protein